MELSIERFLQDWKRVVLITQIASQGIEWSIGRKTVFVIVFKYSIACVSVQCLPKNGTENIKFLYTHMTSSRLRFSMQKCVFCSHVMLLVYLSFISLFGFLIACLFEGLLRENIGEGVRKDGRLL